MADRSYDTRSRDEILAAAHFAPYLEGTEIRSLGLRELRTLDAFFRWAEAHAVEAPDVDDFLRFAAGDASARKLENLRTALDRIVPPEAPARETVREAIRLKAGRGRACDRRPREVIVAAPHFEPYHRLPELEEVALEDLRVLDRFLAFASARRIEIPTAADFLAFADGRKSSRRLRSLKAALDTLLPGNPAVLMTLQDAIRAKGGRKTTKPRKPRPAARFRVEPGALPEAWRAALEAMRLGECVGGRRPPAESTLDSMEDVLREYARIMMEAGLPVAITADGVRRLEAARTRRAEAREEKRYTDQGNRPATRHTAVQRLRAFAERLGLDPVLIEDLRAHENALRRDLGKAVPLKFGKLDALPGLAETWSLAERLLRESEAAQRRQTRLRLLNEAAILALWTLLPLRLADGRLRWGCEVAWTGSGYRVDLDTRKADVPLQGRLHARLTPFLDALVLNGMDPAYLEALRERAMADELPLFRTTTGRMLAAGYPSRVWKTHMGTGAHISRARVHTELAGLGPEGVEAALALCAQRDGRSTEFYEGREAAAGRMRRGQDMIEALMDRTQTDDGPATR